MVGHTIKQMKHGRSCDVQIWWPSVENIELGLCPCVTFSTSGSSYLNVDVYILLLFCWHCLHTKWFLQHLFYFTSDMRWAGEIGQTVLRNLSKFAAENWVLNIDRLSYRPVLKAIVLRYSVYAWHIGDIGWRSGVVVSGVRRMHEVNPRRARLVRGWVTVFGWVYHLGM